MKKEEAVAELIYEEIKSGWSMPGYAVEWDRLKKHYPEIAKEHLRLGLKVIKFLSERSKER